MKQFEMPSIEVDFFHVEDVVTTSVELCENETPMRPGSGTNAY